MATPHKLTLVGNLEAPPPSKYVLVSPCSDLALKNTSDGNPSRVCQQEYSFSLDVDWRQPHSFTPALAEPNQTLGSIPRVRWRAKWVLGRNRCISYMSQVHSD